MQLQSDKSHRLDEIKTQFRAREGYYRLMNSPDYSQSSQRAMGFSTGTANSNSSTATNEKTSIKISLVRISEGSDRHQNHQSPRQQQDRRNINPKSKFPSNTSNNRTHRRSKGSRDMKICFNVGRELFVYNYDGVKAGPDASNPIYKRSYKGSAPTCHDFNQATATSGSICLLVGFSHGQVQLIDLNGGDDQESCREFNVDRLIDKTRVTCVKWLPNESSQFMVAHASGQLYIYQDDLPCGPTAPAYQIYKQSEGVTVYSCKTKTSRNPIRKWSICGGSSGSGGLTNDNGHQTSLLGSSSSLFKTDNESCSINEFVFSPCAKYLACVSQDGFLRVYCYETMELVGRARSYYGGLVCVCWSPDCKYVVTGGEDDLITVWSFVERRVVARGMGHKSWVSVVAFDSYYNGYDLKDSDVDNYDEDDEEDREVNDNDLECDEDELEDEEEDEEDYEIATTMQSGQSRVNNSKSPTIRSNDLSKNLAESNLNSSNQRQGRLTSYRFGSVGQDTQLCLWDLSDDLLQQPVAKSSRLSCIGMPESVGSLSSTLPNNITTTVSRITEQNNDKANEQQQQQQVVTESDKKVESPETSSVKSNSQDKSSPINLMASSSGASGGVVSGLLSGKGSGFTKTFSLVGKRDKRHSNHKNADKEANAKNHSSTLNNLGRIIDDPIRLLGSPMCPRMNEVPVIEPTICKKISFERLTSLIFCQGGFITSCQDGYVFSWARPSRRTMRISPGQSNEELRVIDVGTSSAV